MKLVTRLSNLFRETKTVEEAINFLIKGQLDAVFFEGRIATKKQ